MKRKCGTCKYFEDRGVANSGICQHIQRRELRDVVLVRQSELACRNSWDQDLWVQADNLPLDDADTHSHASGNDVAAGEHSPGRWDNEEIFRGAEDVPMLSPLGEQVDRVTDIHVPVPHRLRSATASQDALSEAVETDEDGWMARPTVYDVRKRREEERRRQIQARQEEERLEIGQRMESAEAIGRGEELSTAWSARGSASGFGRGSVSVNTNQPRYPDAPGRPEYTGERSTPLRLEGSVHLAPPETPQQDVSEGTAPLPTEELKAALDGAPPVRTLHEPVVHVDGGGYSPPARESRREESPALPDPDANDPVDREERLYAIQRCCGTCRDFRQVADGSRGQCVNPYAFSERRMVQSDQLACRSSLGMWWMPSDEVWLDRADTSHHGRPTPLLDATVRAEQVASAGREFRRR